ncbi:21306_t:CDS:2, partial [Gigaspora rosea]
MNSSLNFLYTRRRVPRPKTETKPEHMTYHEYRKTRLSKTKQGHAENAGPRPRSGKKIIHQKIIQPVNYDNDFPKQSSSPGKDRQRKAGYGKTRPISKNFFNQDRAPPRNEARTRPKTTLNVRKEERFTETTELITMTKWITYENKATKKLTTPKTTAPKMRIKMNLKKKRQHAKDENKNGEFKKKNLKEPTEELAKD